MLITPFEVNFVMKKLIIGVKDRYKIKFVIYKDNI